jgi:RND family efflux transporter MFP subunit
MKLSLWLLIGAILFTAYTAYRMRRIGLRPHITLRQLAAGLLGILLLLGALLLARWVVTKHTPPGHMSVIEAQAMDMSAMHAPEGAAPVAVFTAHYAPFNASVRYAANAVSYQEEAINPRVTGVLEWMPFYPNMPVHKGQVLARLDTAELRTKVATEEAALAEAEHAVLEAQAQYRQAESAYQQAQTQVKQAQAQEKEAQADLTIAQQALMAHHEEAKIAEANLDSALAQRGEAQERLTAAKTNLTYWTRQKQRDDDLLAKGFLSQQQAQQDAVQLQNATAEVASATSRLQSAEAAIRSAKAQQSQVQIGLQQDETMIAQKQAALQAAQAQVQQAQQGVSSAKSARDAARQAVVRQEAALAQAKAQLQTAQVVLGYTTIRADCDGVVTQRLVSPGTLVQPGQTILMVDQIDPIRVQAQVAQEDATQLHIGDPVLVHTGGPHPLVYRSRVSAIFPSADPVVHTVIVEALVANPNGRLHPGDYLTLQVVYAKSARALIVPSSAIVYQPQPTSPVLATKATPSVWVMRRGRPQRIVYTCTMHPQVQLDHPGRCPI